jgi:quercetin dioxygenase-like cupin family protein
LPSKVTISKAHEDKRGAIWTIGFQGKNYEIFEVVRGAIRGGHYHKSDSSYFVIHGKILYRDINPDMLSSERELILKKGDIITISAGIAHLVIGMEDSLVLESLEGEFESIHYPPYRKLVEEYLK